MGLKIKRLRLRPGAPYPIRPVNGLDAVAYSLRSIRPARYASRPASTASFIARAIAIGSLAPAIAVFITGFSTGRSARCR